MVDVYDVVADFEIEECVGGLGGHGIDGDGANAAACFVAVEEFVVWDEVECFAFGLSGEFMFACFGEASCF